MSFVGKDSQKIACIQGKKKGCLECMALRWREISLPRSAFVRTHLASFAKRRERAYYSHRAFTIVPFHLGKVKSWTSARCSLCPCLPSASCCWSLRRKCGWCAPLLKSQELFGDGSRQVGFSLQIGRSLLARLSILIRPTPMALPSGYERLPRKYLCGVVPSIVRNISMKALTLS